MKNVLVTGGAGGIGAAICRRFAAEGYQVIIAYNQNKEKAFELLGVLEGNGHTCLHCPLEQPELLDQLFIDVKNKYGKLDVLVNNAGITTPIPHEKLDLLTDEWIDKIFQINFRGGFSMIRRFKTLLMEASKTTNQALVVNISSVSAVSGIGSNVAYCASKAAIDSMTRSLARALAPQIRVVSVSPGWVLGEYSKKIDPDYLKMQEDLTPMARLAKPEDVASTVFALTNLLNFTTGSIIPVDGGRTLR